MRLILHIGTEKTGSTALQAWLHKNAGRLHAQGVYVPTDLGGKGNRKLALYAHKNVNLFGFYNTQFKIHNIRDQEEHDAARREIEADFAREMEAARTSGCHTVVISNEHLHSHITTAESVGRLRALLAPWFDTIRVLCFLRPQVDFLVSFLSTDARESFVRANSLNPSRYNARVDYLRLYRRWETAFPGHVELLAYKRHRSAITAVCDRLGLDESAYEAVERVNEKIDYRVAALGRAVGLKRFTGTVENKNRFFFRNRLPVEHPITISRRHAKRLHRRFARRNQQLVRESGQLSAHDLTPDFTRYPHRGTFEKIFQTPVFAPVLRWVIVRFNVELWLEKTRTKLAQAQHAVVKRDFDQAARVLGQARTFLANAEQGASADQAEQVTRLKQRVAKLDKKVGSGAQSSRET